MSTEKPLIRANMKEFLDRLTPDERHRRSVEACAQLAATPQFRQAQLIMLFLSMPGEIETSTLALKAWAEGKSLAVPRVDWEAKHMVPVEINSLDTGLATGKYGLREPSKGKVVPLDLIDMIVVPGLAFDRHGFRVGRGRGFYDRFLAQQDFQGTRCALCFHEQLISGIPLEPHDIPMDLIVTDREVVHCAQARPVTR
ncbi:MAG: 5-formyltetrahydrofolate cyclo-ligase [Phycisphaerae bacterium]